MFFLWQDPFNVQNYLNQCYYSKFSYLSIWIYYREFYTKEKNTYQKFKFFSNKLTFLS
jgi:hypothetical protein